jgi:hypothetical protein
MLMAGGGKLQSFDNQKQRESEAGTRAEKGGSMERSFWKGGVGVGSVVSVEVWE